MVLHTLLMVVFVLVAIAMVVLILLQRGAGAQAGSGFGAGASATVFGSRGAGNFLSKSTKWLAITFFGISLFMGWHYTHSVRTPVEQTEQAKADLGLMSDVPAAPAAQAPANSAVPAAPAANNAAVPAAPAANTAVPAAPASSSTSSQNK